MNLAEILEGSQVEATKPENWTSDNWITPPDLVKDLEAEFGEFDLDPCCERLSAKAPEFYTEAGLELPWFGRVFLNPPYSNCRPWLDRAVKAVREEGALVVALLPVRTDTKWFHEAVLPYAEIRFLRGRVKWIGWQGTPIPSPKDPSMVAIYRSDLNGSMNRSELSVLQRIHRTTGLTCDQLLGISPMPEFAQTPL